MIPRIDRNALKILAAMSLAGAAEGMWFYILPVHIRALGSTPSQVGATLSSAGISIFLSYIPAGLLADRFNRRKLLLLAFLLPVLPTTLLAFATRWEQAMVLLTLTFMTWSAVPISSSYLAHSTPREHLVRAYTTVHAGFLTGEIIFPTVGAWIASVAGMLPVFALSALLFALAAIPIVFLDDQPGEVASEKLDYRPLLASPAFRTIAPFALVQLLAFLTGLQLLPNYLREVVGLDVVSIGQLGTVRALGGALFTLLLGAAGGRSALVLAQGAVLAGLAGVLCWPDRSWLFVYLFLLGGSQAAFPLIDALLMRFIPARVTGLALGLQGTLIGIACFASPSLAGLLYERSPRLPLLLSAAALPAMALITLAMPMAAWATRKEAHPTDPPLGRNTSST